MHNKEEISMHQLMLLPFPSGIGKEYFPHLKMISEALMDTMFLKNIHIVDWLFQHKINKWWRMAKGDNPVANIIKKYPFEVQQIKQLLNCNSKVHLRKKSGVVATEDCGSQKINYLEITSSEEKSSEDIRLSNNQRAFGHAERGIKKIDSCLSNLRVTNNSVAFDECNKNKPCLVSENEKDPPSQNTPQPEIPQPDILLGPVTPQSPPRGKISVKKFAKIFPSPSTDDSTPIINPPMIPTHENDQVTSNSRVVTIRSAKPVNLTSLIKNFPQIAHKVANKKIVFIRKNVPKNLGNLKSVRIPNNSFQETGSLDHDLIKNIRGKVHQVPQNLLCQLGESSSYPDSRHDQAPRQSYNSHTTVSNTKLIENSSSATQYQPPLHMSTIPIGVSGKGIESPGLESRICASTPRKVDSGIVIQIEDDLELFLIALKEENKRELKKFFHEDELMFLTTVKNDKTGESFLSVAHHDDNSVMNESSLHREKMFFHMRKMGEAELHRRINHVKSVSRKYSEKVGISDHRLASEHEKFISLLQDVVPYYDSSIQSESDDNFSPSTTVVHGKKCATCNKSMKPENYVIGFSSSASEMDYCLCCDFICPECKVFQGNEKRFHAHLKYHEFSTPHICPECDITFPSRKKLSVHMWTECFHLLARRFMRCEICDIGGFCDFESIVNHFVTMHSSTIVVCNLCCMVMKSKQSCISHMQKAHPEANNHKIPLFFTSCQMDDRAVPIECFSLHLKNHKCVQESILFLCSLCQDDKLHSTKESVLKHLYTTHQHELSSIIDDESLREILKLKNIKRLTKTNKLKSDFNRKSVKKMQTIDDTVIVPFSSRNSEESETRTSRSLKCDQLAKNGEEEKKGTSENFSGDDFMHSDLSMTVTNQIESSKSTDGRAADVTPSQFLTSRNITSETISIKSRRNIEKTESIGPNPNINGDDAVELQQSEPADVESGRLSSSSTISADDDYTNLFDVTFTSTKELGKENAIGPTTTMSLGYESESRVKLLRGVEIVNQSAAKCLMNSSADNSIAAGIQFGSESSQPNVCEPSSHDVCRPEKVLTNDEFVCADTEKPSGEPGTILSEKISTTMSKSSFMAESDVDLLDKEGGSVESRLEISKLDQVQKATNGFSEGNAGPLENQNLHHVERWEEDVSPESVKRISYPTTLKKHPQILKKHLSFNERPIKKATDLIAEKEVEKQKADDSDMEEFSLEIDESIDTFNIPISVDNPCEELTSIKTSSMDVEESDIREQSRKNDGIPISQSTLGKNMSDDENLPGTKGTNKNNLENECLINAPELILPRKQAAVERKSDILDSKFDCRPRDNVEDSHSAFKSCIHHRSEDAEGEFEDSNSFAMNQEKDITPTVSKENSILSKQDIQRSSQDYDSVTYECQPDPTKSMVQSNKEDSVSIQRDSNDDSGISHEKVGQSGVKNFASNDNDIAAQDTSYEILNRTKFTTGNQKSPDTESALACNSSQSYQNLECENSNIILMDSEIAERHVGDQKKSDGFLDPQAQNLGEISDKKPQEEQQLNHESSVQNVDMRAPIPPSSLRAENSESEGVVSYTSHENIDVSMAEETDSLDTAKPKETESDELSCNTESELVPQNRKSKEYQTDNGLVSADGETEQDLLGFTKHGLPFNRSKDVTSTNEKITKRKRQKIARLSTNMKNDGLHYSSDSKEKIREHTPAFGEKVKDDTNGPSVEKSSDESTDKACVSVIENSETPILKTTAKDSLMKQLSKIPQISSNLKTTCNQNELTEDRKLIKTVEIPLPNILVPQLNVDRQCISEIKVSNTPTSQSTDKTSQKKIVTIQKKRSTVKKKRHADRIPNVTTDETNKSFKTADNDQQPSPNAIQKCDSYELKNLPLTDDEKITLSKNSHHLDTGTNDQLLNKLESTNDSKHSGAKSSTTMSPEVTPLASQIKRKTPLHFKTTSPSESTEGDAVYGINKTNPSTEQPKRSKSHPKSPKKPVLNVQEKLEKIIHHDYSSSKNDGDSKTRSPNCLPFRSDEEPKMIETLTLKKSNPRKENAVLSIKKFKSKDRLPQQIPVLRLIRASPKTNPLKLGDIKRTKCKPASKVLQKQRIAFNSHITVSKKVYKFNCHLCGYPIDTSWKSVKSHYDADHSQSHEVCTIAPSLVRLEDTGIDSLSKIGATKRKSLETSISDGRKRRRRNQAIESESSAISSEQLSGLKSASERGGGNFKCKKCHKFCVDAIELRKHIVEKHRIARKNFICLECGENFVVSSSLQKHLKKRHRINDPITHMIQHPEHAPKSVHFEAESKSTNQCHMCDDRPSTHKHSRNHGKNPINRKRVETTNAHVISTDEDTKMEEAQELTREELHSNCPDHRKNTNSAPASSSQNSMVSGKLNVVNEYHHGGSYHSKILQESPHAPSNSS
ncbi:hypothetical protein QAD02_012528 [Eretmocerus hayati]|uniref:Uncharacterized protein n=1 Tax=Eretmocerus hayati TaxID=131215 RepID=A0ACC2P111_9HYME|nr:hypothetical protein QAD02_012528 [Eretmocerus hayati]